jgi:CBS domain-containing protein/ribosome-associated translation inhibitor RaiA
MSLIKAAEDALKARPEDTVSKVASRMIGEKRSEAVVIKDGEYKGILFARELAKRHINNPDKTGIGRFTKNVKAVSAEAPLMGVIESMLINDYKSIPVKAGKKIFVLTKLGILKLIKGDAALKNKTARDIMQFPYCVSYSDSIETAVAVLREMGVSRLPVINKKGRPEGLIEALDLLRADIRKHRPSVGEISGENLHLGGVLASSIMRKNIQTANPSTKIPDLISLMINKKDPTVLIEEEGKMAGVVTPKLILELVTREHSREGAEGVYVRISGLQEEDRFIKSVVDEEIRNEVKKLGKIFHISRMVLHVKKHKETGDRRKFSVKGRLITEYGYFFADDYGWDVTKAIKGILQKFEREILKKKERAEVYRRCY